MNHRLWVGLLSLVAFPAAGDIILQLPIDCDLGDSCFIQNYVDHDRGPAAQDFTCGPLTYDGHKGTDFALPSLQAMQAGVTVHPAAAGVVRGWRDGMPDQVVTADTLAGLKGRECGNGVVIEHGDGWVSQYCHMKQGSIAVENGQPVTPDSILGMVGLSGRSEFPHLHLSLRHNDKVVDPFQPGASGCAAKGSTPLWATPLAYRPGGLIGAGFDTQIPSFAAVKSGGSPITALSRNAPAIVLFGYGYGARKGDQVRLTIGGPLGKLTGDLVTLTKPQAQFFRASGKKRPPGGWPAGRYIGHVRFERDGVLLGELRHEVQID